MLGLHYIKTDILNREYGSLYGQLFSLRQTGDYSDTFGLTEKQVLPLIKPAEEMIDTIDTLIKEKNNKTNIQ